MPSQRPKLQARKEANQQESGSQSRLNYVPPPPRLRSYTDPTLQSLYHDDTDSTRLIQSAPNDNDDQMSYIEDSEEDMAVLVSSASTSLPKLSSMMFNNNFETSMDTSQMNLNLYHCHESSQLNNDNFNVQDFAMPAELDDMHDYYLSQNVAVAVDDSDIILVASQKDDVKKEQVVSPSKLEGGATTKEMSPEREDYDDRFENNVVIEEGERDDCHQDETAVIIHEDHDDDHDNEGTPVDTADILRGVGKVYRWDLVSDPKEDEILECSTQCDEEEFADEKLEGLMEKAPEEKPVLPSPTRVEKKVESFPGDIEVVVCSDAEEEMKLKEEEKHAETGERLTETGLIDTGAVDELHEQEKLAIKSEEVVTKEPEVDVRPEPKKAQPKTKKEKSKKQKIALNELKYFNALKEEKALSVVANDKSTLAKNDNKSPQSTAPPTVTKKPSPVPKPSPTTDSNTNKENQYAAAPAKSIKTIRKRVGSKPLSEICNQQPRSRVGLSKRVRIDSLHNNMKKRKTS
ncbi:hypothetical protein Cantr_07635 [Candida viswanathii]|uniref:Uncharacterized protein n=1 Tax=Candida viswanathii TaxID=5486 RepID=A0A367XZS1_9ASCO|nr:hypothetical protein Cantr_07635 [Candida viswanathii]